MAGQPNLAGWLVFDVTDLVAEEPTGSILPANIVSVGAPFDLIATFQGSGFIWEWLKYYNVDYEVIFFAEAIGLPPSDINLGTVTGKLTPGQDSYPVTLNIPTGIANEGYFEIGCRVRFPYCRGMSGHIEPPIYFEVAP